MSVSASTTTELSPTRPAPGDVLPRLLAGIPERGAMTLEQHVAVHGLPPLVRRYGRRRDRERARALIDELERSGLLGRGGAAFPVASKMRAVASARGRALVVANGTEGEPASLKDRTLLEALPHLVLDGGMLTARALGADELIVCVSESAGASIEGVANAIEERRAAPDFAAFDGSARLALTTVPEHYVAGQESALVNYLGGGAAMPAFTPPMPFEQGVRRRPTLINNVETLAQAALIARHGAPWFRRLGTPTQPGSALVTLSGPVTYPGVYEIEHGASLASLIEAGGGVTAGVRAAIIGGYGGSWIGDERLRGLALSNEHLAPHGASLGPGVVLLLSKEACPVAETVRVARWLAGQSTRQCGPCKFGLDALATSLEQLAAGGPGARAAQRIDRLASLVAGRGACRHPDGAVKLILSGLETFAAEFTDHLRHGPCDLCRRPPELPLPVRPVSATPSRKTLARS